MSFHAPTSAFSTDVSSSELDAVRALEHRRIEATRANDPDALEPLLHEELVYINSAGEVYDKPSYLRKIRTNCLSYDEDFDVQETEVRVLDSLIIFTGVMLGHSRLEGEQQVLRFRCMAVWQKDSSGWRMLAWQSSSGSQVQ